MPNFSRIDICEAHEKLGAGGMATVYRAVAIADKPEAGIRAGQPVALKLLHPHLAASSEFQRRFAREARAATKLVYPGVARVPDEGVTEDGQPWIAMELAEGDKLGDLLRHGQAFGAAQIIALLRHMGEVLEAGRTAGLVHRHIKPDNFGIGVNS